MFQVYSMLDTNMKEHVSSLCSSMQVGYQCPVLFTDIRFVQRPLMLVELVSNRRPPLIERYRSMCLPRQYTGTAVVHSGAWKGLRV